MLLDTLLPIKKYKVTNVIWHQGESDFQINTSAEEYKQSFYSLKDSLRSIGNSAPFFISIATKCANQAFWKPDNPTALGQKELKDNKDIFIATNTDLLENADRASNPCHFSQTGQYKPAEAFAKAIQRYTNSIRSDELGN